jgi:DNA-binding transcriptional MerR regulator
MTRAATPPGPVRIGVLAAQTGCTVPTIRYYEEVGLIPPALRTHSGHRVYQPSAARLLGFVRRCRDFGFSIEQVRTLLSLAEGQKDCAEARDIAQEQLKCLRTKMLELMTLERTLTQFVNTCSSTCAGGPAPKCNILRDLGFESNAGADCCP